jgi:hypothetical protein
VPYNVVRAFFVKYFVSLVFFNHLSCFGREEDVFLITVLHVDILNPALVSSVVASLFCRLAKELIVAFTRLAMLSMTKLLL